MSFHLPTASPEVCKLQSAFLCRRDWMMIRGFARSRFLHHLQESSVHRSARDWRLQLHVTDEEGKCPVWPPVTSRLQPGAEWGPKYFLPPEISNTMNWTLYCTLIQFTIIEIFTKVWRERWRVDGMAPHYCSCPCDWRGTPGTWVHQCSCTTSSGAFVAQICGYGNTV